MSAEEIAGRLRVARVTYYAPTMTDPERRAWIAQWVRALDGIPNRFTAAAFDWWNGHGTHMPTPGHIATEARRLRDDASTRMRLDSQPEPAAPHQQSREDRKRHYEACAAIAARFGRYWPPFEDHEAVNQARDGNEPGTVADYGPHETAAVLRRVYKQNPNRRT